MPDAGSTDQQGQPPKEPPPPPGQQIDQEISLGKVVEQITSIFGGEGIETTASSGGAPTVKTELDASKYLPQPCAILSAATLQQLKISKPGVPDTTSAIAKSSGPFCTWHTDDEPVGRAYAVGFLTGNKNGLSDIYRGGKEAFPGYFEPTDVDSYPAVFNGLTEDRASGGCNITVGISKTLAFNVVIESNKDVGRQSCDLVKSLASTVLKTLKGA